MHSLSNPVVRSVPVWNCTMLVHSHSGILARLRKTNVDSGRAAPDTPRMARSETVRRVKTYSSATGFVYQYYFFEVNPTHRAHAAGREYVYMVSADRHTVFPLKIFVARAALEAWSAQTGRALTGTEEYAAAKLRLFQAFDEIETLQSAADAEKSDLRVDESNLDTLLKQLDI